MDSAKIQFTKEGLAKLKSELAELGRKREPTVERLQVAREMGDLSENAAYKAARFELSDIDRNIRRLENLIKHAVVVDSTHSGTAGFGSRVVLAKDGREVEYQLVSKHESDPASRKLAMESPLGAAIMGKKAGEDILVRAPAGEMKYRIVKVS